MRSPAERDKGVRLPPSAFEDTMKIGIDVDDVLVGFEDALCTYHNHRFGTNFSSNNTINFDLSITFGRSEGEIQEELIDFYRSPYFKNMKPIPEAVTGIRALQDNDLQIITSRFDSSIEHTNEWLARYFPNTFSRIHFTRHTNAYGDIRKEMFSKSEVCKREGISVLIEDSADYIKECASEKTHGILWDKPWNQGDLPPHTTRVFSWKEIVETVNQISE